MATVQSIQKESPLTEAGAPRATQDRNELTGNRIRAYVASMRPLVGVAFDDDESYHRGRSLIERLALSAQGTDSPALMLSPARCADMLCFVSRSEPVVPRSWWKDPENAPSHLVGFYLVIQAIEDSLRVAKERS